MKNLQSFELKNSQLHSLPEEIGKLTNLQRLVLGNLKKPNPNLTSLPDSIKYLVHLQYIDLIGNPNLNFPVVMKQLSHCLSLNNLALMNNGLKKLPEGITSLKNLEMLWMGLNPDLDLNDTIDKLAQLPLLLKIGFGSNLYKSIPPEISRLKRLQTIWLKGNAFDTYPDLSGLTNLRGATISYCGIKRVPQSLKPNPELKVLDLSGNRDINIKELMAFLEKQPKLERLALSNMSFTSIPDGLDRLKGLKSLYLAGNSFSPEDKKKLSQLLPDTEIKY
jgi:Leucine-rich repeat (LRR) protein